MNAKDWFNKGKQLLSEKKYEEALEAFEKAIEKNPQQIDACINKGI